MKESITFSELIERIVEGRYPIGTHVKAIDTYPQEFADTCTTNEFEVTRTTNGFGLGELKSRYTTVNLGMKHFNSRWEVLETYKEMTLAEVQEQLGYKIKIVE